MNSYYSFPFHQPDLVYREYREQTLNSLKHRLLVYFWRRAVAVSNQTGDVKG